MTTTTTTTTTWKGEAAIQPTYMLQGQGRLLLDSGLRAGRIVAKRLPRPGQKGAHEEGESEGAGRNGHTWDGLRSRLDWVERCWIRRLQRYQVTRQVWEISAGNAPALAAVLLLFNVIASPTSPEPEPAAGPKTRTRMEWRGDRDKSDQGKTRQRTRSPFE